MNPTLEPFLWRMPGWLFEGFYMAVNKPDKMYS